MTTPTSPSPRRLQFSLRWLLVVVTFGAVVLAVYRWNWEVLRMEWGAPNEQETIHTTTYHYGWNAKPVKHGRERTFQLETGSGIENIWVEGEKTYERRFGGGELIESCRLNRPLSLRKEDTRTLPDATVVSWEGDTSDTFGRWKLERSQDYEGIVQTVEWRNAQRHGKSIWKNHRGVVLQSAEFDAGRIVKWNDEPIETAFTRWLELKVPDAELRRALSARLQVPLDYDHAPVQDHGFVWIPVQPGPSVPVLFGFDRSAKDPSPWQDRFLHRVFGEILLECALNNWSTLDYRYGCVCTVRISSKQQKWSDPTGSDQVQFAAGSTEEQDWNSLYVPDDEDLHLRDFPALRIKALFEKTSIKVDINAVDELDLKLLSERGLGTLPYYRRPRRDIFGQILYQHGYVCTQNSDGLLLVKQGSELPPN